MAFDAAKGGPGYPPVFREHALAFLDQIDDDSKSKRVSQAAGAFSVSARSIYRWAARQAETGNVENKAHAGQQPRVLDGEGDVLLMLYMVAFPNLLHRTYADCLSRLLGKPVSEDMVADAFKRLKVTRKHIHKIAVEQDPIRNLMFINCPPPWGVKGVSLSALVDVDESFAFLSDSDRGMGYSFVGHKAEVVSTYTKGTKWTIMLAVGFGGLVNYWVHKENTTGAIYGEFLTDFVFPKLENPSYILNDNLEVHFTGPAAEAFAASPHKPLQRPPNNPDKAPVEFFFHLMKEKLKSWRHLLTESNFAQFIAKAIEELPWEDAPAIFYHCGYVD